PAPEKHAEPVDMEESLVIHHWMVIYALQDGDTEDALHHIGHILEMETDHEHLHRMEEAKELIEQGELHEAEHEIEEMLAEHAEPQLPPSKLHLKLALATVEQEDVQETLHHMEQFTQLAGETVAHKVGEVLSLLKEEKLHEAEHEIEEMLETPLGATP
ncbi:MAG: hypothetical protein ACE5IA_01905, partial [Dehalococcoidia bacterium]